MTPIGTALREIMRARGITVADLARDLAHPEPTVRNLVDGKVKVPSRRLRDAIDDYLDVPRGTTLAIAEGERSFYPANHLNELAMLAALLDDEAIDALIEFLRAIT